MRVPSHSWVGWLPLSVLPWCAIAVRSRLPAWGFMCALMFAIFFGLKWLTWWRARPALGPSLGRSLAYLLGWPGTDADAFLDMSLKPPKPTAADWSSAILSTALGAVFLWGVARLVPPTRTLLAGWIGLFGLGLLLLFGASGLLALLWQSTGIDARPIMNSPVRARSPSDFWGTRWNLAFRQLAFEFIFRPLAHPLGIGGATMVTFLVSGFVHELVISLPAGAGYGLPTTYFVLQGTGVLVEHSAVGKRWGLHRGRFGWLFTLLLTAGPVFLLFHPPFVTRVAIPFLQVIGAL